MLKKQLSQVNHLMQGIEKVYEDYAKSVGLTYMSLTVLQIIYHAENPCTQKEICELSHYNKQIVNSIIKGFYDKGHLELKEAIADRRHKYVMLSASGKRYADDILMPLGKIEKNALAVLSDSERENLVEMLERCYKGYLSAGK